MGGLNKKSFYLLNIFKKCEWRHKMKKMQIKKNSIVAPGPEFSVLLDFYYQANLSSDSTRDTLACTTWHIKKQIGHKPLRKNKH